MKALIDLLPVALFVAVYAFSGDIYRATQVLMVAAVAQAAITWIIYRRIGGQMWLVLITSLVFGGLTLALHDKHFLFWKPTIVNWLFGIVLGGGVVIGRNPLRALLGGQLDLPTDIWRNLALGWMIGCFLEGGLNLFVAYRFSEAFWVGYKLWSGFATTILFMGLTAVYLVRGGYLNDAAALGVSGEEAKSEPIAAVRRPDTDL